MANNTRQILIESILGGHSQSANFSAPDEFRASFGINPALGATSVDVRPSGFLRPVSSQQVGSALSGAPLWMKTNPKDGNVYVYSYGGSVYSVLNESPFTITGLTDLNDGGTAKGNGLEYYDNYIYASRDTTVARYGPLNGSPSWTDDYWVSGLSKTELTNTTYFGDKTYDIKHPNHILHRHSDGKLYILDVVDNKGTVHFIQTTKTTVEGDTDNGSTYTKLQVGYGLWPTAVCSYGTQLVIAFYEGSNSTTRQTRAKVAFWDTTSQNINQITWTEFSDNIITSIVNQNGILYFTSTNYRSNGFRLTRYIGGYSFEEVRYFEYEPAPFPGAVDGTADRLLFGTLGVEPKNNSGGAVLSLGLQNSNLSRGLFNVLGIGSQLVSSLVLSGNNSNLAQDGPMVGGTTGSSGNGIYISNGQSTYGTHPSIWWSQEYRIGRPFKITKIIIPLTSDITSGVKIAPTLYMDGTEIQAGAGTTIELNLINYDNYPNKKNIVIRPPSAIGQNSFFLELKWLGTVLSVVSLPITIEYEVLPNE